MVALVMGLGGKVDMPPRSRIDGAPVINIHCIEQGGQGPEAESLLQTAAGRQSLEAVAGVITPGT